MGSVPRGEWTDDDPTSPTNYFSGFGRKPKFYSSPFITTPAQAASAANAIGASQQGVARSLDFSSVPNSSMVPGDLVLVVREDHGRQRGPPTRRCTVISLTADVAQNRYVEMGVDSSVSDLGSVLIEVGIPDDEARTSQWRRGVSTQVSPLLVRRLGNDSHTGQRLGELRAAPWETPSRSWSSPVTAWCSAGSASAAALEQVPQVHQVRQAQQAP